MLQTYHKAMHRRKELGLSKALSEIADKVSDADARVFLGGPGPANSPVRAWVFRQQGIDGYQSIAGCIDLTISSKMQRLYPFTAEDWSFCAAAVAMKDCCQWLAAGSHA